MSTQFETWYITEDPTIYHTEIVPCFLTGAPDNVFRPVLSGFVPSKDAGRHIVGMFGGKKYAQLYNWGGDPTRIRVIIGVDKKNIDALVLLKKLVKDAGDKISPQMISKVKKEIEFPIRPEAKDKRGVIFFEHDKAPG